MGAAENFCLRWNDFESNVSGAFRELRAESDFFDVTLTCDDTDANRRRPMQAHKVILSACSNLFKQMLRTQTGHPNPMIYLRGVRTGDLESVLDFMYQGEVNVAQDNLNSFLAVAEDLQIKGLTQNSGGSGGSSGTAKRGPGRPPKSTPSTSSAPPVKRRKPDPEAIKAEPDMDPGGGGDPDFDTGEEGYGADAGGADDPGYVAAGDDYGGDYGDVGMQGEGGEGGAPAGTSGEQDSSKVAASDFGVTEDPREMFCDAEDGRKECLLCHATFKSRYHVRRHIRTTHSTASEVVHCPMCGSKHKNKDSMASHLRDVHRVSKMPEFPSYQNAKVEETECYLCGSKHKNNRELNDHMRDMHGIDGIGIPNEMRAMPGNDDEEDAEEDQDVDNDDGENPEWNPNDED